MTTSSNVSDLDYLCPCCYGKKETTQAQWYVPKFLGVIAGEPKKIGTVTFPCELCNGVGKVSYETYRNFGCY